MLSDFDGYPWPQPALVGPAEDDEHFSLAPWSESSASARWDSTETSLSELVIIADDAPELLDLADDLSRLHRSHNLQVSQGMGLAEVINKARHLAPVDGFDRVHLIGHGTPGQFTIGDDIIDHQNLRFHRQELSLLGELIADQGDLNVYGCSVGRGEIGLALANRLSALTGADVALSDDPTGHDPQTSLDDWDLEIATGPRHGGGLPFAQLTWTGKLDGKNGASGSAVGNAFPKAQWYPDIGPSPQTYFCQSQAYLSEVVSGAGYLGIDQPETIDPAANMPLEKVQDQGHVFRDVTLKVLKPGTVTPAWRDSTDEIRGAALYWVPEKVKKGAPRILYVHGGSWLGGSPWEDSYPTFAAKIAAEFSMPVLSIDYTLIDGGGNFKKILGQVGKAVNYLSTHEPLDLIQGDSEGRHSQKTSPPLFIMGDSSGGGTALSALVAQSSPGGLNNAGKARLSGGVVYSPWTNLESNGPTYQSRLFSYHGGQNYLLGDVLFGLNSLDTDKKSSQRNALQYMGINHPRKISEKKKLALLRDPLANPLHAPRSWLKKMPPVAFHVGDSEVMLSDSEMMAQQLARSSASVELHKYDGMWHVFPMYSDGCGYSPDKAQKKNGTSVSNRLLMADSAMSMSSSFLKGIAEGRQFMESKTPFFYGHYEYPQGHDPAASIGHSFIKTKTKI